MMLREARLGDNEKNKKSSGSRRLELIKKHSSDTTRLRKQPEEGRGASVVGAA